MQPKGLIVDEIFRRLPEPAGKTAEHRMHFLADWLLKMPKNTTYRDELPKI